VLWRVCLAEDVLRFVKSLAMRAARRRGTNARGSHFMRCACSDSGAPRISTQERGSSERRLLLHRISSANLILALRILRCFHIFVARSFARCCTSTCRPRCTVSRAYCHLESTNQRIRHCLASHTRDANAIIGLFRKTIARSFYPLPLTFHRRVTRYEVANQHRDRSNANRLHFLRAATTSRERSNVRTGVRLGCATSNAGKQSVTKSHGARDHGERLVCDSANDSTSRTRARARARVITHSASRAENSLRVLR